MKYTAGAVGIILTIGLMADGLMEQMGLVRFALIGAAALIAAGAMVAKGATE